MIVAFAVRLKIALKVVAGAERLATVDADKMLRVPQLANGCYHLQMHSNR